MEIFQKIFPMKKVYPSKTTLCVACERVNNIQYRKLIAIQVHIARIRGYNPHECTYSLPPLIQPNCSKCGLNNS